MANTRGVERGMIMLYLASNMAEQMVREGKAFPGSRISKIAATIQRADDIMYSLDVSRNTFFEASKIYDMACNTLKEIGYMPENTGLNS